MTNTMKDRLHRLFAERFGAPRPDAVLVRAPGRVNLIGEHTDYNGGFVLPMAMDRAVWMLAQPREDEVVRVFAAEFNEEATFSLPDIQRSEQHLWLNYLMGVAKELLALGVPLRGMDAVIAGDVPIGAGLSSSAAIEVATAFAFLQLHPPPSTLLWKLLCSASALRTASWASTAASWTSSSPRWARREPRC